MMLLPPRPTVRRPAALPRRFPRGILASGLASGLVSGLAVALAVPGLAAAAPVQRKSDAEIERELAFARGLAAEWGFVDLASEVVAAVEKAGVSVRLKEELGLVKCDVYAIGARNESDAQRRNELFEQALSAYRQFIDDNPLSEAKPQAEAAFVNVSNDFARALAMAEEEAVGEEAERLRQRQIDVLTDAVARTGELIAGLKSMPPDDRTEAQKRELYTLMLNRGQMLLQMGRTQEEGAYSFEQSLATLEDLVFEAGEATPFALRAYVVMGDNYAAQQDWEQAAVFYEAVVNQAIPRDREVWLDVVRDQEVDQAAKEYRWLFVQLGSRGLVEAMATLGDMQEAVAWGLHLYNTQKREGFAFAPIGHLSLLEVARTLVDAGGWIGGSIAEGQLQWYLTEDEADNARHSRRNRRPAIDLALTIAKEVLDANRGNNLQVRAQKLISDITNRPGVEVPPAQLFDAAQGEFYERNYPGAVTGFKRVLGALADGDEALRNEFGPKTLFFLGDCYRRMNRPLEAAIAFKEGATTWLGDPEYDARNAQGYYRSAVELKGRMGDDDVIRSLVAEAEQIALDVGTSNQNEILFRNAEKARRDGEWQEAIGLYSQIPIGDPNGEKALVYVGVSTIRAGEVAQGLEMLDDYVEKFVEDPTNVLKSETKKQRRSEALAYAEFTRSLVRSKIAEKSGTPEAWRAAMKGTADYDQRFPEQDDLGPRMMAIAVDGHLALGEVPQARAMYDRMVDRFPEHAHTGAASLAIYRALSDRLGKAASPEERTALNLDLAQLLQRGNSTAASPSFANLRQESRHWMAAEDWTEAERVLRRIVAKFGDSPDADVAEQMKRYVLPDLGQALLEQQQVAEALEILAPLAAKDAEPKPSKDTILNYTRAVSGWVVEDERGAIQVVPGAGETKEEFEYVTAILNSLAESSGEKWRCEWYELKFRLIFAYHQWSSLDSRKQDTVKQQLRVLETELGGPTLGGIEDACKEDEERAERLGGDVLRKRFLWLQGVAR